MVNKLSLYLTIYNIESVAYAYNFYILPSKLVLEFIQILRKNNEGTQQKYLNNISVYFYINVVIFFTLKIKYFLMFTEFGSGI